MSPPSVLPPHHSLLIVSACTHYHFILPKQQLTLSHTRGPKEGEIEEGKVEKGTIGRMDKVLRHPSGERSLLDQ